MDVGQRVRAARILRWRTRKEFSRATGVSVRVISDLENGKRSSFTPESLQPIEDALGLEWGAIKTAAKGGPLRFVVDPERARIDAVWHRLSPDARRMLAELAERTAQD